MLKKILFLFLLLVLLAAESPDFNAEASAQKDQATWLWNPWVIVSDEAVRIP